MSKKVLSYQYVVQNIRPTQESVEEKVLEDLGEVEIIEWKIKDTHAFKDLVYPGYMMPQCLFTVLVKYTLK